MYDMNFISNSPSWWKMSNLGQIDEEETKELFNKADLTPKNEDLNNFYQDSLENATVKLQS